MLLESHCILSLPQGSSGKHQNKKRKTIFCIHFSGQNNGTRPSQPCLDLHLCVAHVWHIVRMCLDLLYCIVLCVCLCVCVCVCVCVCEKCLVMFTEFRVHAISPTRLCMT